MMGFWELYLMLVIPALLGYSVGYFNGLTEQRR